MKDTKFIELLNLYVDQQIDPADAALLEQEISRNPAHRETYREYCRMHRACGMLFEQSLPQGSVGSKLAASAAAADKVIEFPRSSSRHGIGLLATGLGLAAACAAFVFVLSRDNSAKTPAATVVDSPVPKVTEVVQAPVQPPTAPAMKPSEALFRRNERIALNPQNIPESLQWLTKVDLQPLVPVNPDSLTFEVRPIQAAPMNLQTHTASDKNVENTAIQFHLGP